MSMLQYATDIQSPRRLSLIYGIQSQDDVPFQTELDELMGNNPKLDVTYAVGSGPVDHINMGNVVEGRVSLELLKKQLEGGNKTVFICGPPPFMNSMVHSLTEQGIPHDRIITEAFNQGSHRQTGKVASWPQNMYTLGALGVGLGAFAIMVSEIVKSLPQVPLADENALNVPLNTSGQRDKDLDALVNGLKEDLNRPNSPASDATASTTVPISTTTQSPAATVRTPAPTVQPKCTTSQSGVTTCV
jgi:hypothetical protein